MTDTTHIQFDICTKDLYFLKSRTKTVPSDADAPTLSPRLFQHTSKIPPVPLYEWTSFPVSVLQMWTHLSKAPPLARYWKWKFEKQMQIKCPRAVLMIIPLHHFLIIIRLCNLTFPFGENATEEMPPLCPVRVCKQSPVSTSHNLRNTYIW